MKELHAELEPGARVSDVVGHMWITTTYTDWEMAFRGALEMAAGLEKDAPCSDRQWVTFDACATTSSIIGESELRNGPVDARCWAGPRWVRPISIGPPHVEQFMELTGARIRRWKDRDFGP